MNITGKEKHHHRERGFTIVELLIVIVVIGILASVTVVAYGGIQQRSLNTSKFVEVKAWQKLFSLYRATYGAYPPVPDSNYCLGTGFPDGDGVAGGECRDYQLNNSNTYHETNATTLMSELKKVSTLPAGPRKPVNGTVGPYVNLWSTGYTLTDVFQGTSSDCPETMTYVWDDGNGRLLCQIDVF